MKGKLLLIALCAAGLAGCNDTPAEPEYPTPKDGDKYVFEGTVNTPGFTWKTGSKVGVYSAMTSVKAVNLECKIDGWADTELVDTSGKKVPYTPSRYEGCATARFDTPAMNLVSGPNEFFVYTPYKADMTYLNGTVYGLEIGQSQVMPAPDIASECFAFGSVTGIPGRDSTFKFTLNPVTALVKLTLSSSEFAGCGVTKIELFDRGGTAKLGGGFNVNTNTNVFNTLTDFSKVTVSVTAPTPLTAGVDQHFYVQALPGDFSSADIWAVIYMSDGLRNVTMPLQVSGLSLSAGQTTEITFRDLKSSDCKLAWFNPVDTRHQAALGYAYGDANTYLIQCKGGSTYQGGTYAPDGSIPEEVTIDYRARGNFSNAIDPTGATFEWFVQKGVTYTIQTLNYVATNSDSFTFTDDPATYTVKVRNTGSFAGAPILVMKKGGRTLWAWAFWNISADGTQLKAVRAGDFELANMDIGQNTTQFTTWASASNNAGKPDLNYRSTYYYQWGRHIPVFWSSWPTCSFFTDAGQAAVPVVEGQVSFADALANPVGLILYNQKPATSGDAKIRIIDWAKDSDRYGDLWGGNLLSDPEKGGEKSIYDPCPKGWRVPDPMVIKLLGDDGKTGVTIDDTNAGAYTAKFASGGDNFFTFNGCYEDAVASNGRIATMGMPNSGAQKTQGMVWSNYAGSHTAVQPWMLYYGSDNVCQGTRNRGTAMAVRCMKDTDNR